jgi:hypothetical protein
MSDWNMSNGEGYGRSWTEIAEEMDRRTEVNLPDRMLADRLCHAETPQETIDAVLDEAAARFQHCILFRVQGNVASVWGYRGWIDQSRSTDSFAASPVSGNPLELLTVHPNYRGVTPIEQAYVPFFDQLGLPFPAEISVTPIEVNRRVVGILYGDCGEQGCLRSTETQDLELAARLSFGFALILIKNKIRGLGDG